MKAIPSYIFILISLVLFTSCENDKPSATDPYRAVPSNASLIIDINNYSRALREFENTRFHSLLDSIQPLTKLKHSVVELKDLLAGEQFDAFMKERPLLLSLATSGADKFDLLLITEGDQSFEKFLGPRLSNKFQSEKREYSGSTIFRFYDDSGGSEYYLSAYHNLLLFSKSNALVEEAIRQLNTEYNLKEDPDFQKLYKTANRKDPANFYFNFQEAPPILQEMLPRAKLDFVPKLGEWLELDLQLSGKALQMSGTSVLSHTQESYLNVFSACSAGENSGAGIVPDGFGAWLSLSIENAEQYYRRYENYLEINGRLRKHQQLLEKLGPNAKDQLLNWVDDEFGLILLPGKGDTHTRVAYLTTRDPELTYAILDNLADPEFIEGYRGIILKKLKSENALPRVYGNLYEHFHFPHFFVFENFVVFSNSLPALKGMINDILDEKTLAQSDAYKSFNGHLPNQSNIKIVVGNPAVMNLVSQLIEEKSVSEFNEYSGQLKDFRFAALQFNVSDEVAYANLYLESSPKEQEQVSRIWSTALEAKVLGEPQFVMNHHSRKYDIAVQDEKHKLYLLDKQGRILWSRQLDGPIMGNIHQIDAYRNRRLQMMFNTENTVYMIDRLGRDVEHFPIKLKASCSAPIAVLDYDNNRKYRILIPQGKYLSNMNVAGEKVKGWIFGEAPGKIVSMPQHFAVGGKDVIVAQCANGTLLQLNRRGEQRFKKITGLPQFKDDFYIAPAKTLAESELMAVGGDGMLYSIKPGGSTDKIYLDQDYPADDMLYFEDRHIFSSDDQLIIKDEEHPWQAEFEGDITQAPKAMILKGKFYVAAFSERGEEIRLFDRDGELINGFPVFAQGGFDMGSLNLDGRINIVTSSSDGTLICYKVN